MAILPAKKINAATSGALTSLRLLAVAREPAPGPAGAANSIRAVALNVSLVRFKLRDAKLAGVGQSVVVPVSGGVADWSFANPSAAGSYSVLVEDPDRAIKSISSFAFAVAAAGPTPTPVPTPAPTPVPTPTPVPGPSPTPPPQSFTFDATAPTFDTTKWKVGQTVRLPLIVSGYKDISAVHVRANHAWVGDPVTVPASAGAVEFTVNEPGGFIKAWPDGNEALAKDGPRVPASAGPPVVEPAIGDDVAFARAFRSRMLMGVNIERNAGERLSEAYLRRLKSQGVGWVRLFANSKASWGHHDSGTTARYLDSIAAAVAAGLQVAFDFQDCIEIGDGRDARTLPYVRRVASEVAARNFDPRMVALGAANELAAQTNATWHDLSETWAVELAKALPRHCIITGSGYWADPNVLTDGTFRPVSVKRSLYQWHSYDMAADSESACARLGSKVRTWADSKGLVTFCGEIGVGPSDGKGEPGNGSRIPAVARSSSRGFGDQRPCLWTVTHGAWWRCNGRDTLDLRDDVAAALQEASAHMKTQPYYSAT